MIRIFVTGDLHIGLKYAGHEQADALARARMSALEAMVRHANDLRCDLFAITGDLFDSRRVGKREAAETAGLLGAFAGTVLVLPGNHDFYDRDAAGVWRHFQDAAGNGGNILLLTEYRPYPLTVGEERVVVYPALCTARHSPPGENNLQWIRDEAIVPDRVYRIGMAHGAVEGESADREGQYFLMTRRELERIAVDVWLLGHTHVPFPANLPTGEFVTGERIFNPGTHVQTDVSCQTEGNCFILELESGDGRKAVRARRYVSGTLRFFRLGAAVRPGQSLTGALAQALERVPDASVVDLRLTGSVAAEEYARRDSVIRAALSRFVEGTYDDYGLGEQITQALIDREFPETSLSAKLLRRLLSEPRQAQMVYELLMSGKRGRGK